MQAAEVATVEAEEVTRATAALQLARAGRVGVDQATGAEARGT